MFSSAKTSLSIILLIIIIILIKYTPTTYTVNELRSSSLKSLTPSVFTNTNAPYDHDAAVTNTTLGFERVFAIGLPERSDKRDALALTSSLVGFDIEWIAGVRGQTIPNKAVPFGTDRKKLWENNLGSWRGHMNAVRRIVERNLSSALILEDDMDWDVRLKSQLPQLAEGTRYLQSLPPYVTPSNQDIDAREQLSDSPYGTDWDLLWLGHCGEVFPEDLPEHASISPESPQYIPLTTKHTIKNDPTVPPPSHASGFQNFKAHPYTRWVHKSGAPMCTFAYALSHRGAQKVLFDLSVDHLNGPYDNSLADLCRYGMEADKLGMRCYSVTPGIFFHHKAKGNVQGDSDIQSVGGDGGSGEVRLMGHTENVVWSARNNVKNLLSGGRMISEYPEEG